MKVLVIGSGAREHALVWKIAQSDRVSKIYCAPGNGGIQKIAECINIRANDINMLLNFALKEQIDLTVVGPEAPLVDGIVDIFEENGLKIFGPNKKAARLEGSKVYSKNFMDKYNIPTAKYITYETFQKAMEGLKDFDYPLVIKADGLAGGKGVLICENEIEAENGIVELMNNKKFGEAGEKIVIEEYLEGIEASLLCLINGENIVPMESARDYKKIYDNDEGPNTGGMGCFSPNTIFDEELKDKITKEILEPLKVGFKEENMIFKGVLFIGLMITNNGPKVLEFNVRMGDPETEVVLPRLESDIVDIFEKVIDGVLDKDDLKWTSKKCLTVITASEGYPIKYEKGKEISGLDNLDKDIIVFHGGTKKTEDSLVTNGGRVLAVTALANTLEEARRLAYRNIEKINFEGMYYRKDIGAL
ncbi:phosphoribosylamine--glycine ligase [Caldisalinibacter kiritimatiensis]|uniref:Phosphoribosylamine--glycine ligase n=1 Tax=Caldisalinibacter kiritimatiensis TaxID=1304284 RepID=R1CCY4_9FIRM|nr:phosphoribosylamine--glycine ligase [Caldisalinibacter kiritimatiensis]EOD00155.1 Phosphoribosylamine--glycine ligase [Caldisalinibacter kiritimatiensis]